MLVGQAGRAREEPPAPPKDDHDAQQDEEEDEGDDEDEESEADEKVGRARGVGGHDDDDVEGELIASWCWWARLMKQDLAQAAPKPATAAG